MTAKVGPTVKSSTIDIFLKDYINAPYELVSVSGGLVHHVYKVTAAHAVYFLKVRGTKFAKMPTVESRPEDIEFEYRALQRFYKIAPQSFPEVIAYDRANSMILLSSIMTPDINLEFLLNNGVVNDAVIERIGKLVAKVHSELQNDKSVIRGENEAEYYENNLYYRLSSMGRKPLKDAVDRLRSHKKQIIFGDLSPKNMAIDTNGVYICDLDAAHYGNVLFDAGFFAGHLLLHTFNQPDSHITDAFVNTYLNNSDLHIQGEDEDLLARIMIGTCIYRLDNKVVPYNLPNLSTEERKEILHKLDDLLYQKSLSVKQLSKIKI